MNVAGFGQAQKCVESGSLVVVPGSKVKAMIDEQVNAIVT